MELLVVLGALAAEVLVDLMQYSQLHHSQQL